MTNSQVLQEANGKARADYRFGGVSYTGVPDLPEGNGKLTDYEYFPWNDPEFERDPHPWFTRAQREVPVLREESGTYIVSRYDDVMEFGPMSYMSVEAGWEAAGPWSVAGSTIIGTDQPEHTRLRRHTNKWFAPKAVREWVTTTTTVTNEILDEIRDGLVDGWLDLSVLPTHRTMCRVLQVDDSEAIEVMQEMTDTMPMLAALPREGSIEKAAVGFDKLAARIDAFLAQRKTGEHDGLPEALMEAVENGTMTHEEARATILMLYSLGHMDVGYGVAAGLRAFAEMPHVYKAYRESENLRDAIINEVIRFDLPELCFYRTTLEDVTIQGTEIPAGSRVRFMIGAANRDPEIFEDPHRFDFQRRQDQSRNLSFGLGPHTCAGQGYARGQARAVFDTVAARYEHIELAGEVEMDNSDFSRHYVKLPLRLS